MEENKNREGEVGDLKVYEAGYLIVPSVAEDGLPELVSELKAAIEESGGLFISEDFPKLRPLAYTMFVSKDNKRQNYDQAYFGWFKFEISRDKVSEVNDTFKGNKSVLRFLLIETVKENTLYSHKLVAKKTKEKSVRKSEEEPKEVEAKSEEIDKSIDDLVIS